MPNPVRPGWSITWEDISDTISQNTAIRASRITQAEIDTEQRELEEYIKRQKEKAIEK